MEVQMQNQRNMIRGNFREAQMAFYDIEQISRGTNLTTEEIAGL